MEKIKTKILTLKKENVKLVLEVIKRGGVIVTQTETVYGLVCDAFCKRALEKIFKIKGREKSKALICNISNLKMLPKLTCCNSLLFKKIIEKFWPGPLTIVVKKNKEVLDLVTAGRDTVAIRYSSNKFLKSLTNLYGGPLIITSANVSGSKSKTNILDVYKELKGKVEILIKSDQYMYGVESTIIELDEQNLKILRKGAVSIEKIQKFLYSLKICSYVKDSSNF